MSLDKEPFDHLVYVRVTEACNLYCSHCFIPANPKKMTLDQIRDIPNLVSNFASPGSRIRIQWHGGEPTLMGAAWLREAIHLINSDQRFEWEHDQQTNLMNYNGDFARLYHDFFGSKVCVSWDEGLRKLGGTDEEGVDRFNDLFFFNLKKARADDLDVHATITVSKLFSQRFSNPFDFFAWAESHGIRSVHLERITKAGRAIDHWGSIGMNHAEYSQLMRRFATAYYQHKRTGGCLQISPFDGMLLAAKTGHNKSGCSSGVCDTRFHTIDANGYRAGCTALTSEPKQQTGAAIVSFVRPVDIAMARQKRVDHLCTGCDFKAFCSSGCLVLSPDDGSDECVGSKKLWQLIFELESRTVYS